MTLKKHDEDTKMTSVQRKVNEFIQSCGEFALCLQSHEQEKSPKPSAHRQKRRIKPTLLTSYGLVNPIINESTPQLDNASYHPSQTINSLVSNEPCQLGLCNFWDKIRHHWKNEFIEFDSEGLSPLEELQCIIGCLQAGNLLLKQNGNLAWPLLKDDANLLHQLEFVYTFVNRRINVIANLVPSQMLILKNNHLAHKLLPDLVESKFCENLKRNSRIFESDSGSASDLDALPLAYSDRRDSRNSCNHHLRHANQQKLRDLLLNWIRNCSHFSNSKLKGTFDNPSMVVHEIHDENLKWFSEILIREFEQYEGSFSSSSMTKLEKLEERFTKLSLTENPVIQFVRKADSFKLTQTLQTLLFDHIENISQPIIDGALRQQSRFTIDMIRLFKLGKLLAMTTSTVPGRYEDPVVCFVKESIIDGYKYDHLLAVLPWIISWSREVTSDCLTLVAPVLNSLRLHYKVNWNSVINFAICLLLQSILTDDQVSMVELPEKEPSAGFSLSLDQEENLPGLELIIGTYLSEFQNWINELSQINASYREPQFPLPLKNNAKQIRKIRPVITEFSPSDYPETLTIQRKLRQWFWWQNPILKELCDSLGHFFSNESLELEDAALRLRKILPHILPNNFEQSADRMTEIIICLILEDIQKAIESNSVVTQGTPNVA